MSVPSALAFKYLFGWEYYLRTYPDLTANGVTTPSQAIMHWITYGRFEKRSCDLRGIEIGGSAHNQFFLDTINVDRIPDPDSIYKKEELRVCGQAMPVDVAAAGDVLPFKDKSFDFVLSSHVMEHFFDPIGALLEWKRVARKYIFCIVPHRERTFDRDRPVTPLTELLDRHNGRIHGDGGPTKEQHYSVWETQSFLALCMHLGLNVVEYQDKDDKVGNGFSVVISV
jgi:SAM-dependent methyltransferase